jgi:hypothetical protein
MFVLLTEKKGNLEVSANENKYQFQQCVHMVQGALHRMHGSITEQEKISISVGSQQI